MAIRWMKTSLSVVDWNRQPRRTSARRSAVRVGQVAVVRDREAAELEIGIQRLHVAQHGLAGGGVAVVTDRACCPGSEAITRASPKLSPTRPMPRWEWKRVPSKVTMPVASWPRCCSACRPSAVTAAASGGSRRRRRRIPRAACRRRRRRRARCCICMSDVLLCRRHGRAMARPCGVACNRSAAVDRAAAGGARTMFGRYCSGRYCAVQTAPVIGIGHRARLPHRFGPAIDAAPPSQRRR